MYNKHTISIVVKSRYNIFCDKNCRTKIFNSQFSLRRRPAPTVHLREVSALERVKVDLTAVNLSGGVGGGGGGGGGVGNFIRYGKREVQTPSLPPPPPPHVGLYIVDRPFLQQLTNCDYY